MAGVPSAADPLSWLGSLVTSSNVFVYREKVNPNLEIMSSSGSLLREARLRAGLSQGDLGERTGKDRAQIARWERDANSPPYETLRTLIRACGFDLSTELVAYDAAPTERVQAVLDLSPQDRLARMVERRDAGDWS
jgi:transcriptional regulator with XRE-family HTH domain